MPRLEVHSEEHGDYIVASKSGVRGDDGAEVSVEARFHRDTRQGRFVVRQAHLEQRTRSIGVSGTHLSLQKGGEVISRTNLHHIDDSSMIPWTIAETQLFDSNLMDYKSDGGRATAVCAHFELTYATEGYFSLSLQTCYPRPLGG